MHEGMSSAPFTAHSWPRPLLGDPSLSEDPEPSVPPCLVSGHCAITR